MMLPNSVRAKIEAKMRKSGKPFEETVNETLRFGLVSPSKPFVVRAKEIWA